MKNTGLLLSIGMIVKNEETYLEGCLKALQPLRDAVPNELLITDTGSTDRTVEIAEKYTDQVQHIVWENDFAAARNIALAQAKGKWFFYIDADEWLDGDVSNLAEFFLKETKAEFASVKIRNYTDPQKQRYQDFDAVRIFRRRPDRKFSGCVHESVDINDSHVALPTLVHHYGYSNPALMPEKARTRNIPLLEKAIEQSPNDPHFYFQIGREYMATHEYDKSRDALEKAIALIEEGGNFNLKCGIYHSYFMTLNAQKRPAELLEKATAYLQKKNKPVASDVDLYLFMANSALLEKRYEDALTYVENYFETLHALETGKIYAVDRTAAALINHDESGKQQALAIRISALHNLKRYEEVLEEVRGFHYLAASPQWSPLAHILGEVSQESGRYDVMAETYLELEKAAGDKANRQVQPLRNEFIKICDQSLGLDARALEGLGEEIQRRDGENNYGSLLKLRAAKVQGRRERNLLEKALGGAPKSVQYGELLGYAVEWGTRFTDFTDRLDCEEAKLYIDTFKAKFPNYPELIRDYYEEAPAAAALKEVYWEVCLCEQSLLYSPGDRKKEWMPLFERYCRSLGQYVGRIYSAKVLVSEITVLPRAYRFGYYAGRAFMLKDAGDITEGIQMLAKAGENYVVMLPFVKEYAAQMKEELQRQQAAEEEYARVSAQVKQSLKQLMALGRREEAAQLLEQYAKINPKDPEIPSLRLEIASSISVS